MGTKTTFDTIDFNFMDKEKTFRLFDIRVAHRRENNLERHVVNKQWQSINFWGGMNYPFKKKQAFSS